MKRYQIVFLAFFAFSLASSALTEATRPSRASFCKSYGCIQVGKETRDRMEVRYSLRRIAGASVTFDILLPIRPTTSERIVKATLEVRRVNELRGIAAQAVADLLDAVAGRRVRSVNDPRALCSGFPAITGGSGFGFNEDLIEDTGGRYALQCDPNWIDGVLVTIEALR